MSQKHVKKAMVVNRSGAGNGPTDDDGEWSDENSNASSRAVQIDSYDNPQQPQGTGNQQQPYGGGYPQQPQGTGNQQQPYGGGYPQQPYAGGYQQQPYAGSYQQQPYGGGYYGAPQ